MAKGSCRHRGGENTLDVVEVAPLGLAGGLHSMLGERSDGRGPVEGCGQSPGWRPQSRFDCEGGGEAMGMFSLGLTRSPTLPGISLVTRDK